MRLATDAPGSCARDTPGSRKEREHRPHHTTGSAQDDVEGRADDAHAPYPSLALLRVADAMHPGLVSCPPSTPLRTVARLMATYRVHAILVPDPTDTSTGAWRVISDTDLIRAAAYGDFGERLAGATAVNPALSVTSDDELAGAAKLMLTTGVSHLVVVEHRTGKNAVTEPDVPPRCSAGRGLGNVAGGGARGSLRRQTHPRCRRRPMRWYGPAVVALVFVAIVRWRRQRKTLSPGSRAREVGPHRIVGYARASR